MSQWLRAALAVVLIGALAGAAVLLGAAGAEQDGAEAPASSPFSTAGPDEQQPTAAEAIALERRRRIQVQRRRLRRQDSSGEQGPPPLYHRQIARETPEARASVRRFAAAFSLYELGRLGPSVERGLRASATRALARELLSAPPRVPAGAAALPRARPGRLEFVPLASERPTQRLQRGQLVGELRRGRRSEPIAFDLERGEDGEWLVSGLGR